MRQLRKALAVGALGIGALVPGYAFARPEIDTQRYALDAWWVDITTDRFSGDVQCRLHARDHHAFYVPGAVGLQMGRHTLVLDSWIHLDDEPASRWRDQLPELARTRVAIDGRDMESPTDGIVWLPLTLITGKAHIAARGKRPRRFGGIQTVKAGAVEPQWQEK